MGWEIFPDGLTELLLKLHAAYELPPIYITENGMANPDTVVNGEVPDARASISSAPPEGAQRRPPARRERAGLFPVEPAGQL
jgi:hypothetical protein